MKKYVCICRLIDGDISEIIVQAVSPADARKRVQKYHAVDFISAVYSIV